MQVRTMDIVVVAAVLAVVALGLRAVLRPDGDSSESGVDPALRDVARAVDQRAMRRFGLTSSDLRASDNPIGGGTVVHVGPRPTYTGLAQKPVWIHWQGEPYAVNGPAKTLTPDLPWAWPRPQAGSEAHWRGSGLVQHSAGEMVGHLYTP